MPACPAPTARRSPGGRKQKFPTMKVPASGSHWTRRWRKKDSNRQSPVRETSIFESPEIGFGNRASKQLDLADPLIIGVRDSNLAVGERRQVRSALTFEGDSPTEEVAAQIRLRGADPDRLARTAVPLPGLDSGSNVAQSPATSAMVGVFWDAGSRAASMTSSTRSAHTKCSLLRAPSEISS
jgi:hypothetical protein